MNITRREALKAIATVAAVSAIPSIANADAKAIESKTVPLEPPSQYMIDAVKRMVDEIQSERGYPIDPHTEYIECGCPACIVPRLFFDSIHETFPDIFVTGWYFQNGKCPNMPDLDPHHISVRIERFVEGYIGRRIMPSHKGGWKTYDLGLNSWIEENINA